MPFVYTENNVKNYFFDDVKDNMKKYLFDIIHISAIQSIIFEYLKLWTEFKCFRNPIENFEKSRLAYSSDGKCLASTGGYWGTTINIWNANNYDLIKTFKTDGIKEISCIKYSSDNKHLIFVSNGIMKVWDVTTYKLLNQVDLGLPVSMLAFSVIVDKTKANVIAVSALRNYITQILDIESFKLLHTFNGYSAFSPNGKYLALIDGNAFEIFDSNSYKLLHTENCKGFLGANTTYSANSKHVAYVYYLSNNLSKIRIRDVESCKLLHEPTDHRGTTFLAYSQDGKYFVSGGEDCIRIRDANNYRLLQVLKGHIDSLVSLVFSPDSKYLAMAHSIGFINIWHCNDIVIADFPSNDEEVFVCHNCRIENAKIKCSRCQTIIYCSQMCQRKGMYDHLDICCRDR